MPGTFFQQVTPQQADVSQPWASFAGALHHALGFPERCCREQRNGDPPQGRRQELHRPDLESRRSKRLPGKNYVINGYVNEKNIVDRVETWLGDNIMGDMHILATYTGWKDFGGVMAPSTIVQTRGGWPFFEVDCDGGEGES